MNRYERYKKYWYPHITTMMKLYPDKLGNSKKSLEAKIAITKMLADTIQKQDGVEKIKAINSIYFEKKKTTDGVAMDLYVSKRTVETWVHDFTYGVAKELGYLENEDINNSNGSKCNDCIN